LSQEELEKASDGRRFYNVDRFRDLVDSKASVVPPKDFRPFLAGLGAIVDSISGLLSALAGMLVVFVSPVIVIVGALHGLVWFVVTFLDVLGGLGLYVERRMGASLQLRDYDFARRVGAQLLAFGAVLAIIVFFVLILPKLAFRLP